MSVIVGITHSYNDNFVKLNTDYLKVLAMFGVTSLIIPYCEPCFESINEIFKIVDGIILSGGGDLSELLLSEPLSKFARNVYPKRDLFEMNLCKMAFEKNIPLLGICRGIQVMNNSLGGLICQHITGHSRDYSNASENDITHNISICKDSLLYKITDTQYVNVNSFHHQCISKISPLLSVCAKADDSVIEAVECKDKDFFLGVQFHPEKMVDSDFALNIFNGFINACKKN